MADIPTAVHVLPLDLVDGCVSLARGLGHRVAEPYNTEHAAAARHDVVSVHRSAGMEYFLLRAVRVLETDDEMALVVCGRVTVGCKHDSEGRARIPICS